MITKEEIHRVLNGFNGIHALVIGDVMVDAYLYGSVDRISPEAPVPVVSLTKRVNMLGGAANVALNLKALGAVPRLFSVIGNDPKGSEFLELLKAEDIDPAGIITSSERITTTKFRIIGNKSHMLRVDEEITNDLTEALENELIDSIIQAIHANSVRVIIFQDYDKGIITPRIIQAVVAMATQMGIPVVVDPKKKNFNVYKGLTLFKPNIKELREGLKTDLSLTDPEALYQSIITFQERQQHEMVMVTLGDQGILIRYRDAEKFETHRESAHIRRVSDVSGAGDTVISVAALCTALNASPHFTAFLSNLAGGIVCEYVGVVPVNKKRLEQEALNLAT